MTIQDTRLFISYFYHILYLLVGWSAGQLLLKAFISAIIIIIIY